MPIRPGMTKSWHEILIIYRDSVIDSVPVDQAHNVPNLMRDGKAINLVKELQFVCFFCMLSGISSYYDGPITLSLLIFIGRAKNCHFFEFGLPGL